MAGTLSELPREFRIDEEIDKAGQNSYVNYGQVDDDDDIHWTGTMYSKHGHVIMFSFELDDKFPKSTPKVKFSDEHMKANPEDQDADMQKFIERMKAVTKNGYVDQTRFKWDMSKYLHVYFGSIRDYVLA